MPIGAVIGAPRGARCRKARGKESRISSRRSRQTPDAIASRRGELCLTRAPQQSIDIGESRVSRATRLQGLERRRRSLATDGRLAIGSAWVTPDSGHGGGKPAMTRMGLRRIRSLRVAKDQARARHQMDPRESGRLSQGPDRSWLRRSGRDLESDSEPGRGTARDDSEIAGGASRAQRRLQGDRPGHGREGRGPRRSLERGGRASQDRDPRGRGQRARDREEISGPARRPFPTLPPPTCRSGPTPAPMSSSARGRHAPRNSTFSRSSISSLARRSG